MRVLRALTYSCLLLMQAGVPTRADDALVTFRVLTPETALGLAQAALDRCRADGFQVAVAVVDRMGITQVLLRDRYAGPHTLDAAQRKAATAASFRDDTLLLARETAADTTSSGIRSIEGVLMIGGGIPVSVSGSVVGAVGVAGAATGEADHVCAAAGIASIIDHLELSADE